MAEEGKKPTEQKPTEQKPQGGLQDPPEDVTIPPADNKPKGAGDAPEDTLGKYLETINKQQEYINTLIGQVDSLNKQIVSYVRSTGAEPSKGTEPPDNHAQVRDKLPEDYVYLKDLGKEIGKR